MALQRTKLQDPAYVPTSPGSVYANPAATTTYIRGIIIFNGHTAAETVDMWNVPDNATALGTQGDSNKFWSQSIAASETVIISFPHPVVLTDQNDAIFADCTTGSKVTIQFLGDKDA